MFLILDTTFFAIIAAWVCLQRERIPLCFTFSLFSLFSTFMQSICLYSLKLAYMYTLTWPRSGQASSDRNPVTPSFSLVYLFSLPGRLMTNQATVVLYSFQDSCTFVFRFYRLAYHAAPRQRLKSNRWPPHDPLDPSCLIIRQP